jgi:adenosine deaminase
MFFDRGVPITLSTDDPAIFETTLLREYQVAAQAGFTAADISKLAQSSFEYALIPSDVKQSYISVLKNFTLRNTPNTPASLL